MKLLKSSLTVLLFSFFLAGAANEVIAQDRGDAVQTYNKAREMVQQEQYEQAINMYNQAINISEKLGEEGQDIVERARERLPEVYYQIALQNYREFQQDQTVEHLDATIEGFKQAQDAGKEYGNNQIAEKAKGVVTQLLYSKSVLQYKQENYEAALATLDQVIERNPNYAKAYYQKGIVVKNMEDQNVEKAIALFDKAIEVGQQTNDNQIVSRAREAVHEELVYRGAQASSNKNFDRALDLLNQSLDYGNSADAHYRLAEAYNKTQNWEQAVNHAQEALGLESGGRTEKAKIYFEMATAYKALGQEKEACSAYGNAAYGSFKSPAEHQMEYELNCETTTN